MTTAMPEDPQRASVARAHIAAVTFGWAIEPDRLVRVLTRGCWPGASEGTPPVTAGCVRDWGTSGVVLQAPGCECAEGLCLICN